MKRATPAPRSAARAATTALTCLVLIAALALPISPADAVPDQTYADDFSPAGWNGSDGSIPWLDPWVEQGESDGISVGSIRVGNEPNCPTDPCLLLGRDAGPDASVSREADLTGFATAQLEFDYRVHPHQDGNGSVELWISQDGGSIWTQLATWELDSNRNDTAVFDITDYMGPTSTIRFAINGSTDDSHMDIDDVIITASGRQGYFDEFSSTDWDDSAGSLDWSDSPWVESEGDSPNSGLIQAIAQGFCASGQCLRIEGSPASAGHSIARQVDLTGATFASLFFNYRRESYSSCSVRLDVSDDGGSSWAPLALYPNNGGDPLDQSEAIDIFAYAAADTQIRFSSDRLCASGEFFYADNIWVYTDASLTSASSSLHYLVATTGGGAGGDDLLTRLSPSDYDASTNETNIGTGLGTWMADGADVDPDTSHLYVSAGNQIGVVDPTSGVFIPLSQPLGVGDGPLGPITFGSVGALAFHPSNGDLYAVAARISGEDLLLRIDPATGAHVPAAFGGDDYVPIESLTGGRVWNPAIDFDPDTGVLYGISANVATSTLVTIDPVTGETTEIGNTQHTMFGLAFDDDGQLWGVSSALGTDEVYEIDKSTGEATDPRPVDNGSNYRAIAIGDPPTPNSPPVFGQDLLDRTDAEGDPVSIDAAATDPEGHSVSYSVSGLPSGLWMNPSTGSISGSIDFTAAASSPYDVTITATDNGLPQKSASDTFTWTVTEQNRAPAFSTDLPNRTDAEGDTVSLDAGATDPDTGDTLTYGASGLPTGLVIDTDTGEISGTIAYTAATDSPYSVTITVVDDGSPNLSAPPDTFTWTVTNTNQPPLIVNPGPQTIPELSPFSMVIGASDPDGTTPTLTDGGTLPAWATLTDNLDGSATVAGTPGIGDSGTTTITITASDGSLSDEAVFDITVTNTNVAPTIVNPGDQSGSEGSPLSFVVTASDLDGTTVSFTDSATLPTWATLIDNGDDTATISGTPGYLDAGTTTVTISASDGSLADDAVFDIIIANTNRAPNVTSIEDQTVAEGEALTPITAVASDPDGATPSLAVLGLPAWAGFVDNGDGSGTITGTPGYDDAATTTVTVEASDGSLVGTTEFDLTVTDTNRPPVLSTVPDQSIAEGAPLPTIAITATDPDGTVVTLAAFGLPSWATFVDNGDGSGTVTGTPGYNDAATTTVTIIAEDGGIPNLNDSISFSLTVENTNRAPVLDPISNQTVAEGAAMTPLIVIASDPDGTIPSLSAVGLPVWAGWFDNGDGTGTVSGTPGPSDAGVSTVTITADDGDLVDQKSFDLTVTEGNLPPVFSSSLPNRSDAEGDTVSFDAGATDPNNDGLSYSAAGLPSGTAINPSTGRISGTLSYEAAGSYAVSITVEDDGTPMLSSTTSFTWTVTDTNRAPILAPISALLGPEQTGLTFAATASDPDGHGVTYSLAGAPAGATIDPASGVFTWTPTEAQGEGSYAFAVVAADNGTPSLSDTETITITVTEVNLPPVVDPISDQHNEVSDLVEVIVAAADPDVPLNSFTFAASGLPAGLSIHATTGRIFGSIAAGAEGTHDVTVTVTDDGTPPRSAIASFKWLVGDTNHPPEMNRISDRTVAELSEVTIRPVASDPDGDRLRYEIAGAPPGSTFDGSSGTFRWTPSEEQGPGTYRLSIIAADDGDPELVAIGVVTITVTEVNTAPTLTTLPNRTDDAGSDVSLQVVAADTDLPANTLKFTATDLPPGLSIDPATGIISGQIAHTADEETQYSPTVTVTDDGQETLSAAIEFTWTVVGVEELPENFPPSVEPISAQYSDAGATVSLAIQAGDDEPVTFSADGLPNSLIIDPATGTISGTVTSEAIGTHVVVVTATDTGEVPLRTSVSFTWTVTNRDAADQKDGLVVAIADIGTDRVQPTAESVAANSRPIRRGLVVMSSAAAATTESMRLPMALLLALLFGFATIGRVGLYPLLWRGERHTGTLGVYEPDLDFGLINPDDGGEQVFVHANAFPRRQRVTLTAGMRIRYRVLAGDNRASAWGATTEVDDG